ncbi:MAG: protein kinase, partial [candidate division Zixibacteria bacterium]|nr:protein kinase [candidate division Zixibacteria bacterium]
MIGEQVKHYEIISQLGVGGMGEVYLAKDTRLDRQVALKFLPREIAGDADRRKRLELEARTASSLDHPNILTIYEIDDHEGRPFIAMAYVEGGSLKERLEQGTIDIEDAARYGVQIASGLGAAHARGIVHRDIKPDNILIDENNRARLTDFGLAKLKESSGLTGRGTAVGTVGYMSPEQAQGLEVDARSDVFSLGVLLYELFTGEKPFVAEHAAAALYAIVHETPTPVRELNPDIPEPLAAVVARALAKDPSDRYPDARAVESELRTIARDLEYSRVSSSGAYAVHAHPPKTKRFAWAAAGVIIILVGLVLTFSPGLFSSEEPEVQATENSVAVMYFENLSDPDDEERLGDIITELLTTDLSGSDYLKVVSTQRLHDLLSQEGYADRKRIDRDVATKIASKAGASRMLIGTLSKLGGRTIITAQVVDVSSGEVVGSQRVDGTDVFAVVDELSTRIKQEIGLSGPEVYAGDVPISEATTSSAEAYREYLMGMEYYHALEWEKAHEHFDRALELDSTFALAYLRKGVAYSSDGQTERGIDMLRQAGQYIDRTTGCDRLLLEAMSIHLAQNWDQEAALETLKRATTQY